ncbi:MAG: Fe-S cluster assembly protein IscX [Anaerolineae bacterium]|nr:Fe-S cluster assembly protein IscX [Anaerolineae bacterium]
MMVNSDQTEDNLTLDWDASYEIIRALQHTYPAIDLDSIGLKQLKEMIVALPNFVDDPSLAHDGLLREILREWYEESTS